MSTVPSAPGLANTFALIVGALRGVIAARMSRPKTVQQLAAFPVLMLLWHRLGRTIKRFAALAERAAAGTPPRRPNPAARPDRPARSPRPPDPIPRGVAWLIRLLPYEAAAYGSQLTYFLSGPDMAALLEASPQFGRVLRPLCRMLGQPEPARPKPPAITAPSPADIAPAPQPAPQPVREPPNQRDPTKMTWDAIMNGYASA